MEKIFNELVVFPNGLLCCFFFAFACYSVKIVVPGNFQDSQQNAHQNSSFGWVELIYNIIFSYFGNFSIFAWVPTLFPDRGNISLDLVGISILITRTLQPKFM